MKGEGKAVPLDVFGVGAEVGCVVNFVVEKLSQISKLELIAKDGQLLTIPVTLFPITLAG